MPDPNHTLADSEFIALTTFRRTGEGVATPVWVVSDDDTLLVSTPAGTGKLKRLAHTPRVTVVPCSRRGRVPDDAVPVAARATVVTDQEEVERVDRMLADKYGFQFRLFMFVEKHLVRGERRREIIRIVADREADADVPEADAG